MATTTKKPTKAQMFKQILDNYELTPAEQDFIKHEIDLLAKKNSAEKKPTAQQVANDGIKSAILAGMEEDKAYTIGDLIKTIPECADFTTSKVSALVRQLKECGAVVRTEDKRKAYFTKV